MHRSILITGCSSGIGYRAAHILKKRGYRVFATARKPQAVQTLIQEGFESFPLDLNDSHSIQSCVANVLSCTQGTLDALFNNAGYGQPGAVEDLSRQLLKQQFETNLFGLQELTNLIIPIMRQQGHGRIINVSSVLGFIAMPYRGAYVSSKFALEGLTDTLRLELHNTPISVSLIEPGPIQSRFRENVLKHVQSINLEGSAHQDAYEKELKHVNKAKRIPFTQPPDAVVKKLIHALESKRPKPRYRVTFITHLFALFKRILPTKALDWIILKMF